MRESLVNRLKARRKELTESKISLSENFWTRLVNNGTLTNEHVQLCKAESTEVKKLELLLDMLERRDDSCFQKFCQVLCVSNPEIVEQYLNIPIDDVPRQFFNNEEAAEQFNGSNIVDYLERLRKENLGLLKTLEEESATYGQLEIANAKMQEQLEEAKKEVREHQLQHEKLEESFENNIKKLAEEKSVISVLEKEKQNIQTKVDSLEVQLNELKSRKKLLDEEVHSKTMENKKLGKQISFHRTHLSSLGSRSFSEAD